MALRWFAGVDIVLMYMLPEGHKALAPILEERLVEGCGTRVVVHQWPIPGWDASASHVTSMGTKLFMYTR